MQKSNYGSSPQLPNTRSVYRSDTIANRGFSENGKSGSVFRADTMNTVFNTRSSPKPENFMENISNGISQYHRQQKSAIKNNCEENSL